MSPAFSHCFLKRLSAFSKLSSGSTITLVTRNSPLSHVPEALTVYHAPPQPATCLPLRTATGPGGMATGRGWRGCPPWTTLSRSPRGHSGPPRDFGLALRRSSPEDTGPGRAPPPTPPSPLWDSRPSLPVRVWVWFARFTARGGGWGRGLPPRSRIFWGDSSKRQTTFSWRARVATGSAGQRGPRSEEHTSELQ